MFSFLFIVVPEKEKLDGGKGNDGIEPSRRNKMEEQHKNAQLTIQASRTVKHRIRDQALEYDDKRDNNDRKNEKFNIEPRKEIHAQHGEARTAYGNKFRDPRPYCLKRSYSSRTITLYVFEIAVVAHQKMSRHNPIHDKFQLRAIRTAPCNASNREQRTA
jgi:hypothetical protein